MGFWIVWAIVGMSFVLLFALVLFPRIVMKMNAASYVVRGRAVGRIPCEFGTTLLYEPAASVRKYIASYRVGRDAKGVYFQGEWAKKIACAVYELVVYNAQNEIIEIMRVKEKFNDDLTTHVTRLPKGADYVSLRLVSVDDTPFPVERRAFNLRYAAWLGVLSICLALTTDLLLWLGMTLILRFRDRFTAEYLPTGGAWTLLLGVTAAVVIAATWLYSLGRFFLLYGKGDPTDE